MSEPTDQPSEHHQDAAPLPQIIRRAEIDALELRPLFDPPPPLLRRAEVDRIAAATRALDDAHARATSIIADAHAEADALRDAARAQGHAEGWAEVLEALGTARAEYDRLLRAAEPDMLELAFQIAARLVRRELARDPEMIREMVASALEHVRGKRQIIIVVHPDDRATLEATREALCQRADGAAVYIDEDTRLQPGDCVLETESGRVDARLEVQLDVLRQAIRTGAHT